MVSTHGISMTHAGVECLSLSRSSHLIVTILVIVEECSRCGNTLDRSHHIRISHQTVVICIVLSVSHMILILTYRTKRTVLITANTRRHWQHHVAGSSAGLIGVLSPEVFKCSDVQ